MAKLATIDSREVARPLKVLVPLIREELEAGEQAGVEHYRRAGQMLLEAKSQVANRNEWFVWLKRNFKKEGNPLSETTANRYMQLAGKFKEARGATRLKETFPTLSSFTHPQRDPHHNVSWQEPVRESINKVDVDKLIQERQGREKEERLVKEVALRLIDIGYRALAAKLHPDAGGSVEAMGRLNKARDLLKRAV
jgi:hypothetical protein